MTPGKCSACGSDAERAPSGRWYHVGPSCWNRSQFLFQVAVVEDGVMRSTRPDERPAKFIPLVGAS